MGKVIALPRRLEGTCTGALSGIESSIIDASASEPVAVTTLAIENMHCGSCMRRIEDTLIELAGVVSARTNLSTRRVAVLVRPNLVDTDRLIATLADQGFKATELAGGPIKSGDADAGLLRRLAIAGFAAANIMLLSVSVWSGTAGDMEPSAQNLFHWLSALLALPAVAYAGQPFFASAAQALQVRRLNMDVPISLGVLLATAMSLYQTARGSHQVYFDAAVALLFFLLLGRFIDQTMRSRAAGAAANLLGLRATSATVLDPGGASRRVPIRELKPGMKVLVTAGERVPVDGQVVEGTGEVDESLLTGESLPRRVGPGATLYAGTINLGAPLPIEAKAIDHDTLLSEVGRLMEAAEQARGHYVRLADRAARLYAPAVHALGLTTFVGWIAAGQGWEAALTAAISVLIITCPCALALAVPATQVAAASRLFCCGVLLKAPDALERLADIDTVVLDKTGTLSLAEPVLEREPNDDDDVLGAAARLAAVSRHPYARALSTAAREKGITIKPTADVSEVPGQGLARRDGAGEERLGSAAFCGVDGVIGDTATLWYARPDRGPVAFRFVDRLRPDAVATVSALHEAGYSVELLSGDRAHAVEAAAEAAGISRWRARQRPDDKIRYLEALKADGRKVLMVGDGLNDAPALAAAAASLSPATAADISQTAADAIFQGERLQPLVDLLSVAQAARRLALQNFGIAVGYNFLFVPLAMLGLVTPLVAAIAMSTSSIAVTANAVRLRAKRLRLRKP
jgi:Cu2+-exporting ATPase